MTVKRWNIYRVTLDPVVGQTLFLSHPDNNFGLTNESIALCHQIRTIDKKRMAQEYGHINDTNIQMDKIAIKLRLNGTVYEWHK